MNLHFLKYSHPFVQVVFFVFLMLASFLIFSFVGTLLAIPLFHLDLSDMAAVMNDLENPGNIRILKYLQLIQSLSLFVVPPFLFLLFYGEKSVSFFGFNRGTTLSAWISVFFIMIFLIPVNNFLVQWNGSLSLPESLAGLERLLRNMEQNAENLTRMFLKMNTPGAYLFNMFLIAIVPAIGEELTFRGVFQPLFIRWTKNVHAGILVTGFLFSFFHFQFFGFFPRWLLGILFGYLYYRSGTIWVSVLAHFINNGMAVTAYWVLGSEKVEQQLDHVGASGSDVALYAGILGVALFLWIFYESQKSGAGKDISGARISE